ncbi:hypothetical protein MNV49_001571 [Pseudohyphozyma bogoriensis]|nr:hypothetical protein MNV49_001571 [Pseudohyphozyma bogoriensis]
MAPSTKSSTTNSKKRVRVESSSTTVPASADLKTKDPKKIKPVPASADKDEPEKGVLKKSASSGKKGKKAVVEPSPEPEDEEEEEEEDELDFIKGFESDEGEDSSDEEGDEVEGGEAFEEDKLPAVKGDKEVERKLLEKAERKKNAKKGTIYLGRIPKGFHEEEMKSYFSQFGEVTRLRLSRNKKTGASKHYAFIEFAYESVAKIVQETMNNYLLAGHILICQIIPQEDVHPKLWVGEGRKFRVVPKGVRERKRREGDKTEKQLASTRARLLKRESSKRKKLAELGIEYDFPGFEGKEITVDEKEKSDKEEEDKAAKKSPAKGKGKKAAGGEPAKKKARKST